MKKIILMSLFVILFSFLAVAQEEHDFNEAKQLINSGVSCSKLSNEQLESIGDYYMEQMHPGEAHEYMDKMMGGEGSESLKQVHINLARRVYCNENAGGMMSGMMAGGMMNGGMMGNNYQSPQYYNSIPYRFRLFEVFFYIILTLVIVVLILAVILLNKPKNSLKQKGGNNRK